jgi:hypothetical protein
VSGTGAVMFILSTERLPKGQWRCIVGQHMHPASALYAYYPNGIVWRTDGLGNSSSRVSTGRSISINQ